MKIKHFAIIPPPYGGASVYVKRLNLSLCKHGILSGAFFTDKITGIPSKYKCLYCKFPTRTRSIFALLNLPYILKQFTKCDIIHMHFALCMSPIVWLPHKILGKPLVYTLHNQMIDQEINKLSLFEKLVVKSLANDKSIRFTTVNALAKERLLATGIKFKNDITVITPYIRPVQLGEYKDYLDSSLIEFIETHKKIILFYSESFAKDKEYEIYGSSFVIDSFVELKKTMPDCSMIFCIANIGTDDAKIEELKTRLKDCGLENDVFWQVGAISEMWPLHETCSLYVRPTSTDGDSVMLREALSFGLPVVASNVTARPEGCRIFNFGCHDDFIKECADALKQGRIAPIEQKDHTDEIISIYQSLLS